MDHNQNRELQRKIIKALNEEIGGDLKQLYKLKELYDETKAVQNELSSKVRLEMSNFILESLIM